MNVLNPLEGYMQGLKFGEGLLTARQGRELAQSQEGRAQEDFAMQKEDRARKIQEEQAKREQAARGQQALLEYLESLEAGTANGADLRRAMVENPLIAERFQSIASSRSQEQLANDERYFKQIAFSVGRKNTDVARNLIQERIDAAIASGDEAGAAAYKSHLMQLDNSPETLLGTVLSPLAANMKPDDFDKFHDSIFGGKAKDPTEAFRTTDAQLRAAGIVPIAEGGDGRYEKGMAGKAGLGDATVEAVSPIGKISQDVKNKIIPQSVLDTAIRIEEKQTDEGLTLQQQISEEARLRGEFVKRTEDVTSAKRNYDLIETSAADDSGAGDIALVTSFMKMLDPGSVVRETEFATARDTGGLFARLKAAATKIEDGRFLSPDQRQDFVRLSGQYLQAAQREQDAVRQSFEQIVENYKLNPVNVFGSDAVTDTLEPPKPGAIPQSFLANPAVVQTAEKYGIAPEMIWDQMNAAQRSAYE
jgi:hypothetical protein